MDVLLTTYASYVTRDLVNCGGEPAKIALGLLKLTVPSKAAKTAATAKNLFVPSWRTVLMLKPWASAAASASVTPANAAGEASRMSFR